MPSTTRAPSGATETDVISRISTIIDDEIDSSAWLGLKAKRTGNANKERMVTILLTPED